MDAHSRHITYYEVTDLKEVSEEARTLIEKAKKATERSYAPFSKFHVGAAVLLRNGETVVGCNQENEAFPSGLCAERTAIFSAGAQYPNVGIKMMALAAETEGEFTDEPVTPCGACLQVMLEAEKRGGGVPIEFYLYGEKRTYIIKGVNSFLPFAFKL